jgi:hypothetical protein
MRKALLVTTLMVLAFPLSSFAGTITFYISATGTGNLGGTSFTNEPFTFTAVGDTSTIFFVMGNPRIPALNPSSITIVITGVGSATILEPGYVFDNQTVPGAGIGTYVHSDLVDLVNPAFAGYGLNTSFGPVSDSGSLCCPGSFNNVSTDQGLLSFTSLDDGTFAASAVPEPSTMVLLGTSVLGAARFIRRKRA